MLVFMDWKVYNVHWLVHVFSCFPLICRLELKDGHVIDSKVTPLEGVLLSQSVALGALKLKAQCEINYLTVGGCKPGLVK